MMERVGRAAQVVELRIDRCAIEPAAVLQQLSHGDAVQARIGSGAGRRREVGEDVEGAVREPDPPLLDQFHHCNRRDWFR
jgi:hypothetical protein